MREILFRGKRKSDGKWLYGLPADDTVCGTDFPCIMPLRLSDYDDEGGADGDWAVLKETVGQYTGLTDRNGKKIFEGDIVKYIISKGEYEFAEFEYGNIIFLNGRFQIAEKPCDLCVCSFDTKDFDLEVIGNIYDNPELLRML